MMQLLAYCTQEFTKDYFCRGCGNCYAVYINDGNIHSSIQRKYFVQEKCPELEKLLKEHKKRNLENESDYKTNFSPSTGLHLNG